MFKLKTPPEKSKIIKSFVKQKLPHFFLFAKDKEKHQVADLNGSVMNRLYGIIPNNQIKFKNMDLGEFDYKVLLKNKKTETDDIIIQAYVQLNSLKRLYEMKKNNIHVYNSIKKDLLGINPDEEYITDVLIDYLYREKPNSNKETLWKCFGWTILRNIRRSLGFCEECGIEIENKKKEQKYCDSCAKEIKNEQIKIIMREKRAKQKENKK